MAQTPPWPKTATGAAAASSAASAAPARDPGRRCWPVLARTGMYKSSSLRGLGPYLASTSQALVCL